MARSGGIVGRLVEAFENTTGITVAPADWDDRLLEAHNDNRLLRRSIEDLGWSVHGLVRDSHDFEPEDRIKAATRARQLFFADANIGHAVRLRNAFVFGRGVQPPRARDEEVQEVIDDFWTDPQNQRELTSPAAQVEKGTDLALQATIHFAVFDDGMDGRVLVDTVHHDRVTDVVRDPDVRKRILYWVASEQKTRWDFGQHRYVPGKEKRVVYYADLRGLAEAESQGAEIPRPNPGDLRDGRILTLAVNKTSEMAFGYPELRRIIRWAAAYNDLLYAQTEKAKAVASLLMKAKARGPVSGPQLANQALQMVGRAQHSQIGGHLDGPPRGPRPASTVLENESLTYEPLKMDSGATSAAQDMEMARSQVAVGAGFGPHYFGNDPGSLAGATTLELPTLKIIQLEQEQWEGVFRALVDRAIGRAVETGRLSERRPLTDEEIARGRQPDPDGLVERDLGYEFSMPDPLRRVMLDIISACTQVMTAVDPQGQMPELTRTMLGIILSEAFELEDAQGVVDRIIPPGSEFLPEQEIDPATGQPIPPDAAGRGPQGEANPYGARLASQPPEDLPLAEASFADLENMAGELVRAVRARWHDTQADLDQTVRDAALRAATGATE